MRGVVARELEVRQAVSARDPGMLQNLLGRVSLVGVDVEHVGQQVLQRQWQQLSWHSLRLTTCFDGASPSVNGNSSSIQQIRTVKYGK